MYKTQEKIRFLAHEQKPETRLRVASPILIGVFYERSNHNK